MTAKIVNGSEIAQQIREELKQETAITPVPGGVGPMTITTLMMNTVKAAKLAAGIQWFLGRQLLVSMRFD